MALQLSLRAVVTIVVKKRLVNSIPFLFCRQRGGCRALAEVVGVAARWRQPAWRRRRQLGRSAILAVAVARLEIRRQRGGGGGNNGALAVVMVRVDC